MAVKLVKMDLERIASTSTIQGGKHNNPTPPPLHPGESHNKSKTPAGSMIMYTQKFCSSNCCQLLLTELT